MPPSKLEEKLARQIAECELPEPERQYRFHPLRRWRADFAWPEQRVLAEVDGGSWVNGRHSRGAGQRSDCERQAEAVMLGWKVYRFTSDMVQDRSAIDYLELALCGR